MKELYLNDKKAVIDQNLYFPFNQKIANINDVSVIGVAATKTVEIPRCAVNDEIFGGIAEIARNVVSYTDNLIGISFNQIKKMTYKLYSDSELISQGIVRITGINKDNYSIELYDKLADLLVKFAGDEETGDGYLNNMDLIISGSTLSLSLTANNIKALNDAKGELIPGVNLSEFLYKGDEAWVTSDPFSGVNYYSLNKLNSSMTPIQFRTLKPYDFEFNVPISTVINSINMKYSGDTQIVYDDFTKNIFDNVSYNLGKPKKIASKVNFIATGHTYTGLSDSAYTSSFLFETTGGTNLAQQNGKYFFRIPISITFVADAPSPYYTHQFVDGIHYNYSLLSTPLFGGYIGSMYVYTKLKSYSNTAFSYIETAPVVSEIRMDTRIFNGNTTATYSGADVTSITVNTEIPVSFDYYYSLINGGNNDNYIDITLTPPDMFAYWSGSLHQTGNTAALTYGNMSGFQNNLDIRTGDIINGYNLFPKTTIQNFLLDVVKYYNLGIEVQPITNYLNISKKEYVVTSEVLNIESISDMQISNFDFSKIVLSSKVCSNTNYKDYNDNTKKIYAEQIVNTGYSIRNSKKEIKFDIAIPGILKDTNSYAYSDFAGYYNFGYSKTNFGSTEGLTDSVTIGYNYNILDPIWVSDDLIYEANLSNGFSNTTEIKFTHSNLNIIYNEYSDTYTYPTIDNSGATSTSRQLESFYTLSPYLFIGNDIQKSLELNKPTYNFADISDDQYSITKTHYYNYWQKYIADIYDVNTHILSTKMYISGLIDIFKIYNYMNSYYIISEITEYDPTLPAIYEIKLLRVNNLAAYETINVSYPFEVLYSYDLFTSVCQGTGTTAYCNTDDPFVGDFLYVDSGMTIPWNLGGLVYIDSLKKSFLIDVVAVPEYELGQIISKGDFDCAGYTGTTTTTTTTMSPTTTTTTTAAGEYIYSAREYDCSTCLAIGSSKIISNPYLLLVNKYYDDFISGSKWRILSPSSLEPQVYTYMSGSGQSICNGACV